MRLNLLIATRRTPAALAALALLATAPAALAQGFGPPAPAEPAAAGVSRLYDREYRTDTFEIPLSASGEEGNELEYKVRMKSGDTVVYSWAVEGVPADEFYFDFHGEADAKPPLKVVSYKEGTGVGGKGALVAPFDGIHGWFFQNSAEKPVTVKLTVAGFYELRSIRETMGLDNGDYLPFGPPSWPQHLGPQK
jgi:hypothetical protein